MFRFLHAADIHLDSPLRGLERYEGAPVDEIRGATRRALQNLVDLAIERDVDFVLIAGDLYDGDWKDHNTGLYFVSQMVRLRDAGIAVVLISGNHDAANKMTKSLRLPDNVELLSHRKPATAQSARLHELGVSVHGRSFGKSAEFENLAIAYPERDPGQFNIGLLHTSLTGAEGHESYAPCSLADLRSKEYDYWALGHVHQRQIVSEEPPVVFPGNAQGRHVREPGAKGCYLVQVDDRGHAELEFQALDVFRWDVCHIPLDGLDRAEDVLDRFAAELMQLVAKHDDVGLGVRVELTGRCQAHERLVTDQTHWINQIRSTSLEVAATAWVETIKFLTTPEETAEAGSLTDGPLGELVLHFQDLRADDDQLVSLARELEELKKKLPDDLLRGDDALLLNDPEWLRGALNDVEPMLVSRLQKESMG